MSSDPSDPSSTPTTKAVGGVVGMLNKILDAVLRSPAQVVATVAVAANGEDAVHAMTNVLSVVREGVLISADRWRAAVSWFGRRWYLWVPGFLVMTALWGYLTYTAGALGGDPGRMRAVLAVLIGFAADFSAFGIIASLAYWAQVTLLPIEWACEALFRIGVLRRDPEGRPVFDAAVAKKVLWHFLMVKVLFAVTLLGLPNLVTFGAVVGILLAFVGMIAVAKTLNQKMDVGYKILYAVYAVFAIIMVKIAILRVLFEPFYNSLIKSKGDLSNTLAFVTDHGWTRTIWECCVDGVWVVGKDGKHWDAIHTQLIGTNLVIDGQYEQYLYGTIAVILCLGVLGSMLSTAAVFFAIVRGHVWSQAGETVRQQRKEAVLIERETKAAEKTPFSIVRATFGLLVVTVLFIGGCYGCKTVAAMAAATPAATTVVAPAPAPTVVAPTVASTTVAKMPAKVPPAPQRQVDDDFAAAATEVRRDLLELED